MSGSGDTFWTTFSAVVSPGAAEPGKAAASPEIAALLESMRQMADLQRQQLEVSKQLLAVSTELRQHQLRELEEWRKLHPDVARDCKAAHGVLQGVQVEMLREVSNFATENREGLSESEFVVNEFIDRFGPRLTHLMTAVNVMKHYSQGVTDKE